MPGNKISLNDAVARLRSAKEAQSFLEDLTTPAERCALEERWRIAQYLDAGELSYREIASTTGASTTTVARVARFLKAEPDGGYKIILNQIKS